MVHGLVLGLHIAAGALGLVLGPVAAMRRGHGRWLAAYELAVFGVCATALALVAIKPSLWPFALLALGTAALVIDRRRATSRDRFVRLTGGSYISLVTALLVVSWGSLASWLLPTLLGVPLVEWAAWRSRPAPEKVRTG